jgi:hypothetical protein
LLDLLFQQAVGLEDQANPACSPRKHDQCAPPHLMASKQRSITKKISLVYKDLLLPGLNQAGGNGPNRRLHTL